jgi:hypothetical protein
MGIVTNIFTVHNRKLLVLKVIGNVICTVKLVAMFLSFQEDISSPQLMAAPVRKLWAGGLGRAGGIYSKTQI